MQVYKNLHLVGSSHISRQSINEIKSAVKNLDPYIVAVELDRSRLHALFSKNQGAPSIYDIKKVGFKGFLFAIIGSWASNKLGKLVGVKPGSEMKTAIILARKSRIKVALIDQRIDITLKKLSASLTWRERWHFIIDLIKGVIFRKKDPLLNFDLSKVPDKKLVKMMVSRIRQRYPNIYKVLIHERNYYMARKIKNLITQYPDKIILAVVGAGHEDDIISILKENEGVGFSYTITHEQSS